MGIYILGPAFLFANMEYDLHNNALRSNYLCKESVSHSLVISHPPKQLRIEVQLEILYEIIEESILNDDIKKEIENVKEYFESYDMNIKNRLIRINKNSKYIFDCNEDSVRILLQLFKSYIPLIKKYVLDIVRGNSFNQDKWNEAKLLAENRIANIIPPNETDCLPASSTAIINAAWIARIQFFEEIKDQVGADGITECFEVYSIINDLTLFALNSSRIALRWNNESDKQN